MSTEQLEQRLAAVERELAEIKRRLGQPAVPPGKKGILSIVGIMADYPEFDDVMEAVRRRRDEELAAFDAAGGEP